VSELIRNLPALQVVAPLLGAVIVAFFRRGSTAYAFALAVTWFMPVISMTLLAQVMAGGTISYGLGGWAPPIGIEYRVDALNAFILLVVSLVSAVTMPFAMRSIAFEIEPDRQAWYWCMYLLCLTGLLGITITGDGFNAFVFLEISSLATYVLIALGRDRRALLAAYQYLIMGTIGATLFVIGIGFLYLLTGSLNFHDISSRLADLGPGQDRTIVAALAFLTIGISLKLALFPLHVWLPNAYAYAPSFTTVFLSATATKVAVYLLIRMYFSVFGEALDFENLPITEVLVPFSLAAMFVASLIAVFENNLKRMLAYSSVAQIGYITLGIGIANEAALTGSLVHILNHAIMKAALFMALGAVFFRIGTVRIENLAGIGRKMPLTMGCFVIAGLGLIGVPGTAGFISKWYLAVGALDEGWPALMAMIVASSMIAIVYIGRVVEVVWFREPTEAVAEASDPPLSMLAPLLLLTAATIYFGFDTSLTAGLAADAAGPLVDLIR
jgi:multicomponent Na+:H+ antiporter subunit D